MIYTTPDNGNLIKNRYPEMWGRIITPSSFANAPKTNLWCGDNEVFTNRYRFLRFFRWLWKMRRWRDSCIFIAAPDVVANAPLTILRYILLAPLIRLLGYPVSLVAQDGLERWPYRLALHLLPYDALFIGGSTAWKLSPASDYCIAQAKRQKRWVHVGRVNSQRRMKHFKLVGVNSVDGTSLTYAPDRDFWRFNRVLLQPPLFTLDTTERKN